MPMTRQLEVRLHGDMSQGTLEKLRKSLKLKKRGRLTDLEDVEFGYRYLQKDNANWIQLSLQRTAETDWFVVLTYLNEPVASQTVEQCRADILAAAKKLGFTAEEV
jgi:hypothetical protein